MTRACKYGTCCSEQVGCVLCFGSVDFYQDECVVFRSDFAHSFDHLRPSASVRGGVALRKLVNAREKRRGEEDGYQKGRRKGGQDEDSGGGKRKGGGGGQEAEQRKGEQKVSILCIICTIPCASLLPATPASSLARPHALSCLTYLRHGRARGVFLDVGHGIRHARRERVGRLQHHRL